MLDLGNSDYTKSRKCVMAMGLAPANDILPFFSCIFIKPIGHSLFTYYEFSFLAFPISK